MQANNNNKASQQATSGLWAAGFLISAFAGLGVSDTFMQPTLIERLLLALILGAGHRKMSKTNEKVSLCGGLQLWSGSRGESRRPKKQLNKSKRSLQLRPVLQNKQTNKKPSRVIGWVISLVIYKSTRRKGKWNVTPSQMRSRQKTELCAASKIPQAAEVSREPHHGLTSLPIPTP